MNALNPNRRVAVIGIERPSPSRLRKRWGNVGPISAFLPRKRITKSEYAFGVIFLADEGICASHLLRGSIRPRPSTPEVRRAGNLSAAIQAPPLDGNLLHVNAGTFVKGTPPFFNITVGELLVFRRTRERNDICIIHGYKERTRTRVWVSVPRTRARAPTLIRGLVTEWNLN